MTKFKPHAIEADENILHFSLEGGLPEGMVLALNMSNGLVSLLHAAKGQARLLYQDQLTEAELLVFLPLLEAYPYYCSYEVLFAWFHAGKANEKTVAKAAKKLADAQEAGLWEQEIRPVRSALSRARLKIRPLGMDISNVAERGYMLMIQQEESEHL